MGGYSKGTCIWKEDCGGDGGGGGGGDNDGGDNDGGDGGGDNDSNGVAGVDDCFVGSENREGIVLISFHRQLSSFFRAKRGFRYCFSL